MHSADVSAASASSVRCSLWSRGRERSFSGRLASACAAAGPGSPASPRTAEDAAHRGGVGPVHRDEAAHVGGGGVPPARLVLGGEEVRPRRLVLGEDADVA